MYSQPLLPSLPSTDFTSFSRLEETFVAIHTSGGKPSKAGKRDAMYTLHKKILEGYSRRNRFSLDTDFRGMVLIPVPEAGKRVVTLVPHVPRVAVHEAKERGDRK